MRTPNANSPHICNITQACRSKPDRRHSSAYARLTQLRRAGALVVYEDSALLAHYHRVRRARRTTVAGRRLRTGVAAAIRRVHTHHLRPRQRRWRRRIGAGRVQMVFRVVRRLSTDR